MTKNAKIVQFHAMLAKLGALESKDDIKAAYGVDSIKDLTERQLDEVIANLQRGMYGGDTNKLIRSWRSYVLTQLNRCGVYVTNDDWSRVNNYLLDSRICGKLLKDCNLQELKDLHKKLLAIANKKQNQDKLNTVNQLCLN